MVSRLLDPQDCKLFPVQAVEQSISSTGIVEKPKTFPHLQIDPAVIPAYWYPAQ